MVLAQKKLAKIQLPARELNNKAKRQTKKNPAFSYCSLYINEGVMLMVVRILAATLVILSTFAMTGCSSNLASPPVEMPMPKCELHIEAPAQIKQNSHGQIKVRSREI